MKHAGVPAFLAGKKRVLLGNAQLCLNVKNLKSSLAFYGKLGFRQIGGNRKHNYAILKNGSWTLGLFQGHIKSNLVNFRGGDVASICRLLKQKGLSFRIDARHYKGGVDAVLSDPDGNSLYFDTTDPERLR